MRRPRCVPDLLFRVCVALSLLSCGHAAEALAQDQALIERARRVSVASLDSSFVAMPLELWLTTLRPLPPSALQWEVNDCGEGGDGLRAPTCVEAILRLSPDTAAHASLILAGLDGAAGEPGIWMLYAVTRDSIVDFKSLHEWMAFVRGRGRPFQPPRRRSLRTPGAR